PLAGLHGVVICDADDAGIKLGATRASLLRAAGVRLPDSAVLFPVVPGLKKPDLSDAFAWAEREVGRDDEDFAVHVLMTLRPVSEWVPMPSFEERMEGYFARTPTGVERCGPHGARIYICLSKLAAGSGRARATKAELASYLGVGPKAVAGGLAQLIAGGYLIEHKRPWYLLPHESPGGDER
ncbi:MAG: hypothetical protein JWO77_3728, partial [Ilumatobacteraceae bacterium]|nr:hypothetical protein [Ilumatobacteraceae bacterium]